MSNPLQKRQSPGASSEKPVKPPTEEDFKGKAVSTVVLKESVEHPATIYPLAVSAIALGWTMIIAPSPVSIGVSLGLAFVGCSSFVYNFVVKGPEKAEAHITKLRELRRAHELLELNDLASECESNGLYEAGKEARELKAAYEELVQFLNKSKNMSSQRFRLLAQESFEQGFSVLRQALEIHKAMSSVDVAKLTNEIRNWSADLQNVRAGGPEEKIFKKKIESHERRVDLYAKSMNKLAQLIAESNEIESALQSTYIELVDLGNQDLDYFLREDGGAANRLRGAVDVARKVEERMRGGEDGELDALKSKYLDTNGQSQASNQN